jgi:hypothetical protein
MCMIGDGIKRMDVPREKAIRASKRFGRAMYPERPVTFRPTSFTDTHFIEDGGRKTNSYRVGHDYSTVKPTKGRRSRPAIINHEGNGRGFWAYRKGHGNTSIGDKTLTVLLWGRVVEHQLGYRAEHMRILRQAIPQ